jgi:hypothetical protein
MGVAEGYGPGTASRMAHIVLKASRPHRCQPSRIISRGISPKPRVHRDLHQNNGAGRQPPLDIFARVEANRLWLRSHKRWRSRSSLLKFRMEICSVSQDTCHNIFGDPSCISEFGLGSGENSCRAVPLRQLVFRSRVREGLPAIYGSQRSRIQLRVRSSRRANGRLVCCRQNSSRRGCYSVQSACDRCVAQCVGSGHASLRHAPDRLDARPEQFANSSVQQPLSRP